MSKQTKDMSKIVHVQRGLRTKQTKELVSAQLRKIGCRCVLDDMLENHSRRTKPARVECLNSQAGSSCSDKHMDSVDVNGDVSALSNRVKAFVRGREGCV